MIYEVYKNNNCKYEKYGDNVESEDIISLFKEYIPRDKGVHVYIDFEHDWHCVSALSEIRCCEMMCDFLDDLRLEIDGSNVLFEKITDLNQIKKFDKRGYCAFLEVDLTSECDNLLPKMNLFRKFNGIIEELKITGDYFSTFSGNLMYYSGDELHKRMKNLQNIEIDGWVYIIFRIDYSFKDGIIEEGLPPPFEYLFIPFHGIEERIKKYFDKLKSLPLSEKEFDRILQEISEEQIIFLHKKFTDEIEKFHKENEENFIDSEYERGR